MKYTGKIDLVPMKLTMQDLRCDVYLVFSGKQCRPQSICNTVAKLGFCGNTAQIKQLKKCVLECKDNPGYTLSLSNLECIIVINPSKFTEQTTTELIGTLAHEMSHAVTMLFNDLGCDDDELRSIELENILIQTLKTLKLDELIG